jgi:exonuclease III
VQDLQGVTICQIANVYAPAQQNERLIFLESFHELPQFHDFQEEPWLIMGDFNTTFKDNMNTHTKLQHLHQWLKINVNNCFPKSTPTFKEVIKGQ